jgi:uncharacterized protein YprB with RNaseH-like and TPR domain
MIEHMFIHIQGIGEKTERKLWKRGIHTWQHFLQYKGTIFSPGRDRFVKEELEASISQRHNIRFFQERLASTHIWRLFNAFRDRSAFLDIETSGGYQGVDEITVIGLYNGTQVQSYVNGKNLNDFEIAIAEYDLMITFNGTSFDVPFIRQWFPGISLPPAHIDLRFLLKKLGFTGGLKRIEKEVGLQRDPEIDDLDGYDAVMLWNAYQWGDHAALKRLIQYNTADIVNLKPLMELAYSEMKKKCLSI